MFERFTEQARQVVVFAQDEARALKHNYIGTEHILLGLLREEEGLAARVLESLEITVEEARRTADVVGGEDEVQAGQIPFTPRAKTVLELALREALGLGLGHNYIGPEHILLGLIRENGGVAARILLDFDADAGRIHDEIISQLQPRRREGTFERMAYGPRPTPRLVAPRWEYKVESLDVLSEESLNELGAEGWELTGIVGTPGQLVFKRRARD